MTTIRARALATRSEPVVRLRKPLMGVLARMPHGLAVRLVGGVQRSVDVTTSNVPGWPIPTYLAGALVEQSIGLGPLGGAAINVTVMSHVDRMSVGITLDPSAVPDREVLLACLREGFAQAHVAITPALPL